MIHIESSTQINRSPDEVFEFIVNVDNMRRWQKGVVRSRRVSSGPMRLGFQFEETVKVGPWKLDTRCTVTELKKGARFGFEAASNGPLDYEGRFDLSPLAGGTRLSLVGIARLKGLWRVMQPLFAEDIKKETRDELDEIKRLLEIEGAEVAN